MIFDNGTQSAVADLESEMKLLRWHKLANESALKAAILKNKASKRNEKEILRLPFNNHIHSHLNDAMREERSKELMTDEAFVRRYQQMELKTRMEDQRRCTVQQKRLDSIQKKLQEIDENRYRKLRCSSINTSRIQMESEQSSHDVYSDVEFQEVDSEEETDRDRAISATISTISQKLSRPSTIERTKLHFEHNGHKSSAEGKESSRMMYTATVSKEEQY